MTHYVASCNPESYTCLKGQYELGAFQGGGFRVVVDSYLPTLLLVAFLVLRRLRFLGSKLVTLGSATAFIYLYCDEFAQGIAEQLSRSNTAG
jgi:hypothetical protein